MIASLWWSTIRFRICRGIDLTGEIDGRTSNIRRKRVISILLPILVIFFLSLILSESQLVLRLLLFQVNDGAFGLLLFEKHFALFAFFFQFETDICRK